MFDTMIGANEPVKLALTLFTDAFVIKGNLRTRQGRITDVLNGGDEDFIVLEDAIVDEFGTRSQAVRTEYAQVTSKRRSRSRTTGPSISAWTSFQPRPPQETGA